MPTWFLFLVECLLTRLPLFRLLLADLGFFGDPDALSLNQTLATAYRDFKKWCRENRVKCSQPLFRESMVVWWKLVMFLLPPKVYV